MIFMAKPTVAQTKQMVEELLNLRSAYERYQKLEKQVKHNLVMLKYNEINVPGQGRVFISESERVTIPVQVALDILGQDLAGKIIQVKKSVSKRLFDAFVEAGEIDPATANAVMDRSEHKNNVSLYVRPLK